MKLLLDPWGDPTTGEVGDSGPVDVGLPNTQERGGWRAIQSPLWGVVGYQHPKMGLLALLSLGTYGGKRWLHLSVRHKDRIPTHGELMIARRDLLGVTRQAVAIYPPSERWINIHPHVLHLWSCLDGDGLPQFEDAVTGI